MLNLIKIYTLVLFIKYQNDKINPVSLRNNDKFLDDRSVISNFNNNSNYN